MLTGAGWPGFMFLSCDSLKLATTQTSAGTMDISVWPTST